MNPIIKEFEYGKHNIRIETGKIAKQSTGSVMVYMDDTAVLTTVVGAKTMRPGQDFFPLTVNYQEKTYAAGKIPGGFFRREGRPSEKETLTSRLIDRPIRPLFPKGFLNEVQVVCTVMSAEKDQDPDIAAMIGTSAALAISGIPFNGPIGAARVGYKDGAYLLNPGYEELGGSALNMTVAGTKSAVLMVESEAKELSEDQMLGAVLFAHQEMQIVIDKIQEFASEIAKPAWEWDEPAADEGLQEKVEAVIGDRLALAYSEKDKLKRQQSVRDLRTEVVEEVAGEENSDLSEEIAEIFSKAEKNFVRRRILSGEPRIDGRD